MSLNSSLFESPYLKKQLIAYIGNKRRLLSFLGDVFRELEERSAPVSGPLRFGDCFAGSGSVSRLAKLMGYSIAANDWEYYSKIINTAHLCLSDGDADELFSEEGGIDTVIDELNSIDSPAPGEGYISSHYAPADTSSADYRYERLFYTRENALFIDAVRNRIEQMFPGNSLSRRDELKKYALLAPLLYQAATHANTNGVFKAYHKGFGGHGADALKRIMAGMRLSPPVTAPGSEGCKYEAFSRDAAEFVRSRSFDICYLDPPYNQHQYGSNYFMLNTIARWDRPEVNPERSSDGRLKSKAGIRPDWVDTRSPYCYSASAPGALSSLVDSIDSEYIVLSYNTEGIIPFDELFDILSSFGKTEIFCRDYVIYRGGKQSLSRANRNVEFQLVLSKRKAPGNSDRSKVDRLLRIRSAVSMMGESFVPERILERFKADADGIIIDAGGRLRVGSEYNHRLTGIPSTAELESLKDSELEKLLEDLEYCRCLDKEEEAGVLFNLIAAYPAEGNTSEYGRLWGRLFGAVRKFAFRKYRGLFEKNYDRLIRLLDSERRARKPGKWETISARAGELRKIADLRFHG